MKTRKKSKYLGGRSESAPMRAPNKSSLIDPPSKAYKLRYYDYQPAMGSGPGWYWVDGWAYYRALKSEQ